MRTKTEETNLNLTKNRQVRYKGFNGVKIDGCLVCRGFKFQSNTKHTLGGEPVICETGFHACECPVEVLKHYAPSHSRYGLVEQTGRGNREKAFAKSTKIAAEKIRVIRELPLKGFLLEMLKHKQDVKSKSCGCAFCKRKDGVPEVVFRDGQYQIASAESQHRSVAWAKHYNSVAAVTVSDAIAVAEQCNSVAAATNAHSRSAVLGMGSVAVAMGTGARAEARSIESVAVATSNAYAVAFERGSVAVSTGDMEEAIACGTRSVAVVWGDDGVLWLREGVGAGYVRMYSADKISMNCHAPYFRVDEAGIIVLAVYDQYWNLLRYVTYLAGKDFELGKWYTYGSDEAPVPAPDDCFVHLIKHPSRNKIPITDADLEEENDNEQTGK